METPTLSPYAGSPSAPLFKDPAADVVEIALLLPAKRAAALVELARRRRASVGQILRELIDHALADESF